LADLHFIVPGDPETRTGGFVYDRRIAEALRSQGVEVAVHALPSGWPFPGQEALQAAKALLAGLPRGALVLVDGLAYSVLPVLAAEHGDRLRLVALVHHPLAEETGLSAQDREALAESERAALIHARHVVATSGFTANALLDYGVTQDRISIVPPGVEPASLAAGSEGETPHLLCVATLTPRKGHDVLLNALAGLADRAWTLDLAGSEVLNVRHATQMRRVCSGLNLDHRVRFHGELAGERLEALYRNADIFVLASHYEGYGMVLTEAVAHGLPVVATAGGAVPYTLPEGAGLLAPPGDIAGLRAALARVLDDTELRERMAAGARAARDRLPTWSDSAMKLANALERVGP
jgi:glycosyltransferase involved in cell wall biosynthesis